MTYSHWTAEIDNIAFTIFGRDVAWYGIIITSAMVLALILGCKRVKRVGITADELLEFFICVIPAAIIFARFAYVIARPEYFDIHSGADLVNLIAIWDGGVSILGAVPGGLLVGLLWCRWRKVSFAALFDIILPLVLLAQSIGRWGNFFNQEIYGARIDNPSWQWFPFAVYITSEGAFYQAAFFYESMMTLAAFAALIYVTNRYSVRFGGTLLYVFSYATIRFVMEFFRDDGEIYKVFNYTQFICGMLALAAAATLVILTIKDVKAGKKVWYKDKIPFSAYPSAKKVKTAPAKSK